MPYGPIDFTGPLAASRFHGLIPCLDKYEPYMPDRVVRQFGRQQCIPSPPIMPLVAVRPGDFSTYIVDEPSRWAWDLRNIHSLSMDMIGPLARYAGDCADDYYAWFKDRTHPLVEPVDGEVVSH